MIQQTTPKNILKRFKNFIGIIDCSKIFIETSKFLLKLNVVGIEKSYFSMILF